MTGFLPVLPDRGCSLPLPHAYLGQAPRCFLSPRQPPLPPGGWRFPTSTRLLGLPTYLSQRAFELKRSGPFKVGASQGPDRYRSEFPAKRPR